MYVHVCQINKSYVYKKHAYHHATLCIKINSNELIQHIGKIFFNHPYLFLNNILRRFLKYILR